MPIKLLPQRRYSDCLLQINTKSYWIDADVCACIKNRFMSVANQGRLLRILHRYGCSGYVEQQLSTGVGSNYLANRNTIISESTKSHSRNGMSLIHLLIQSRQPIFETRKRSVFVVPSLLLHTNIPHFSLFVRHLYNLLFFDWNQSLENSRIVLP